MNLIKRLDAYDPKWRDTVASDPLDAAVELGLIEPEDVDNDYRELDFNGD